jgi:hypothetical protein
MPQLKESIIINTSAKHIHRAIVTKELYEKWAAEFTLDSSFDGSWDAGSNILFTAPNDEGTIDGMISEITENIPGKCIIMRHNGYIMGGKEMTNLPEFPSYEAYFFHEIGENQTEFLLIMETAQQYHDDMQIMWKKAMVKLKVVAESL